MKKSTQTKLFTSLRILTFCAMMTAISVILGIVARQYLTFMGGSIRITFENLPIVLSGLLFGPIAGGVVGLASDLISSVMTGQNIQLLISLGAVLVGVFAGLTALLFRSNRYSLACISSCEFIGQITGSVIMKTIGIVVLFNAPLEATLLYRAANYLGICVLEIIILHFLLKNKSIISLIKKI